MDDRLDVERLARCRTFDLLCDESPLLESTREIAAEVDREYAALAAVDPAPAPVAQEGAEWGVGYGAGFSAAIQEVGRMSEYKDGRGDYYLAARGAAPVAPEGRVQCEYGHWAWPGRCQQGHPLLAARVAQDSPDPLREALDNMPGLTIAVYMDDGRLHPDPTQAVADHLLAAPVAQDSPDPLLANLSSSDQAQDSPDQWFTTTRGNGMSDWCSLHGDIPRTESIAHHLQAAHGLDYGEYRVLQSIAARRAGISEDEQDDRQRAAGIAAHPVAQDSPDPLREALADYDAALRSLVGDHLVHPAHMPDCAVCVALNGRSREKGAARRAAIEGVPRDA